ncbi:MAG: hypothetical protein PHV18_14825 [Lachnospiraceae bacterium]|nr:hypothetical protein [Lachnospiraceae bacterium]
MKYKKKPTYIEAFVLSKDDNEYPAWFKDAVKENKVQLKYRNRNDTASLTGCLIDVQGIKRQALLGEFIVLLPNKEIYSHEVGIFNDLYEPAEQLGGDGKCCFI